MIFNMNSGGGGGENIELVSLTATANGTYTPSSGQAYNEVIVNVPIGIEVNGVQHTYRLAPNCTINKGDFCFYGTVMVGTGSTKCVYPSGYDTGGASSTTVTCIALETKTAGAATETVNIDVLAAS